MRGKNSQSERLARVVPAQGTKGILHIVGADNNRNACGAKLMDACHSAPVGRSVRPALEKEICRREGSNENVGTQELFREPL